MPGCLDEGLPGWMFGLARKAIANQLPRARQPEAWLQLLCPRRLSPIIAFALAWQDPTYGLVEAPFRLWEQMGAAPPREVMNPVMHPEA